jgi:hypothetical protein
VERSIGRPRLRWLDNGVNDLRNKGINQWRKKAEGRRELSGRVREAKMKLKGPYSQRTRKRRV